jgi:ATP-dependent RNA helicase DHX36
MLLAEFHASGFIDEFHVPTLSSEKLAEERDSKVEIYDYAARFGIWPHFTVRQVSKRTRGRSRKMLEVIVTLLEQKIHAVGYGLQLNDAEIAASLEFKRQAEKYHADANAGSLVVKDYASINSKNAKQFIEYYKITHNGTKFDVVTKDLKDHYVKGYGDGHYEGRLLLNGNEVGGTVERHGKKKAEELAYLPAAIELNKQEPQLFPKFLKALEAGNGQILGPVPGVRMPIDPECLAIMRDTLYEARKAGLPDFQEQLSADTESDSKSRRFHRPQLSPSEADERSKSLSLLLKIYQQNPRTADLRSKREELPMNQYAQKVLDMVNDNTYSVIVGATGSGKTTQVPQILLDDATKKGMGGHCNVICTQPRRIAATSVAQRVAAERNQSLGNQVGYHVRFNAKHPRAGGSVMYCTTGILMQQLQHAPDEALNGISHVIIDEVHERDVLIDFLLIILKNAISERRATGKSVPKVVLMSATIDTELFSGYFKQTDEAGKLIACPSLSVPGRLFPVKSTYLPQLMTDLATNYSPHMLSLLRDDKDTAEYLEVERDFQKEHSASGQDADMGVATINWKQERKAPSSAGEDAILNERQDGLIPINLVAVAISHITKTSDEGAILVFLPGLEEIMKVETALLTLSPLGVNFDNNPNFKVIKVHSSLAAGQTEVFDEVPPNCRKIILSTNIAETSVTIADVQFVVDAGKLREKRYDQLRRISRLACTWISKSNATQRAGRAGRVQNGNYLALYSRNRFESLRAIGLPEILRSDLQEICLDIKAQAFKAPIREFLAQAIEPPTPKSVNASVINLQALEALTDDEELTPLGRLLAKLPVHPTLGKMIVLGVIFRCLDPMLVIGAAAAERMIFTGPVERRAEVNETKRSFTAGESCDFIAYYNAFITYRAVLNERGPYPATGFAYDNFIHKGACNTIEAIARQIEEILVQAQLIPPNHSPTRSGPSISHASLNKNSHNLTLVKALALAGHHPNLAVCMGGRRHRTPGEAMAMIHPASVNYGDQARDQEYGRLFTYRSLHRGNDGKSLYLLDTSLTTPLAVCLFGGRLRGSRDTLEMDDWLPFYVRSMGDQWGAIKTIVEFRKGMDRMLSGAFKDLTRLRSSPEEVEDAEVVMAKEYLADAGPTKVFADGLVQVLQRDFRIEKTRSDMPESRGAVDKKQRLVEQQYALTQRQPGSRLGALSRQMMSSRR